MKKPKILYHYTTLDAVINGIINSDIKGQTNLCLWATHCEYLNDPKDNIIGENILQDIPEVKDILDYDLSKYQFNKNYGQVNYILSFSTTCDSLPMWRMYGENGTGIMLSFDSDIIEVLNDDKTYAFKCIYEHSRSFQTHLKAFPTKLKECIRISKIYYPEECVQYAFLKGYIISFLERIKAKGYEYEQEWRMVIPDYLVNVNNEVLFRNRNGLLIPYIKRFFPMQFLKEIWIGPTHDMKRSRKALEMFLLQKGMSNVSIRQSEIPYRL